MLLTGSVKTTLAAIAVAGGAVAALALGPVVAAVGQSSPPTVGQSSQPISAQISVDSPANLVAKGAGVDVSVVASCAGTDVQPGSISVGLTEAVGKKIAAGSGGGTINCTGASQTVDVLVVAEPGKAFEKGKAIATAQVGVCTDDFSTCISQEIQPVIKIRD